MRFTILAIALSLALAGAPNTRAQGGEAAGGMKAYQSLSFVVPRGLHAGEAEVVVAYKKLRSAPSKLTVVERPPRPLVGGAPIISVATSGLPPPPPRLVSVAESTKAELAQLRQLYEAQTSAGREFRPYDPAARYLTIRAEGLDYNPRFLRVSLEQEGREAVTLGPGDFSLFADSAVIVRVPASLGAGATRVTVENRGEHGYSSPAVITFELPARP